MKSLVAVIFAFALYSCDNKKSADGQDHSLTPPLTPPQAPPAQQSKTEPPLPPTANTAPNNPQPGKSLPNLSFTNNAVAINHKTEVQLELRLSRPSDTPVVVDVYLENGTAIHYRDYNGFKTRSAETRQTVIFAPGILKMKLPVIGGRNTVNCDTYFYAKIDEATVQNANVPRVEAIVYVPCY